MSKPDDLNFPSHHTHDTSPPAVISQAEWHYVKQELELIKEHALTLGKGFELLDALHQQRKNQLVLLKEMMKTCKTYEELQGVIIRWMEVTQEK
jgi:hypothetical protein